MKLPALAPSLLVAVLILAALSPPTVAQDAATRPSPASLRSRPSPRLDVGLETADRPQPVFVRMTDQLLPGAGAFEAFCVANATKKRSELRPRVRADLVTRSRKAREALATTIAELERASELRDVTWFWIVNGFAAQASAKACNELATRKEVAFVYRQRGPGGHFEHRPARRGRASAAAAEDRETEDRETKDRETKDRDLVRKVLADWHDDTREPLDLSGVTIPWNTKRVQADRVWTEEKAFGEGVVIAVNDTGLLPIPPLTAALWRNPKEELDGKDDDLDGHVDDIFGWDFRADSPECLGDEERPHGSMCSGIIAGRPFGEPKTITGLAPRARIMVARGSGYLAALEYVVTHDADILSLSFMWIGIDLGASRGLYRTAYEHLTAAGVLALGGAGNFGTTSPSGQQIALPKDIPCVLAAAGILEDGRRPAASSAGPCTWSGVPFFDDYPASRPLAKPDVTGCFGGFPVWGRATFPRAKVVWKADDATALIVGPQGNSFAGPHAAGVAALMLSVNKELNPWEVKEILEATCMDLGAQGRDFEYGAGLLQALPAVRAARARVKF